MSVNLFVIRDQEFSKDLILERKFIRSERLTVVYKADKVSVFVDDEFVPSMSSKQSLSVSNVNSTSGSIIKSKDRDIALRENTDFRDVNINNNKELEPVNDFIYKSDIKLLMNQFPILFEFSAALQAIKVITERSTDQFAKHVCLRRCKRGKKIKIKESIPRTR